VLEPRPDQLVDSLLALDPACGRTIVIAIDGPSGAGKTQLARLLAPRLGATILHLDDVYQGWHGLAAAPATVAGDVLEPISRGETGRTPRWEWGADVPGPDIVVPAGGVLLLDGCGSGSRVIRPFLAHLLWLDAPEEVRRERAFARDGELFRQWWDVWAAQERELFAAEQTRAAADVVLQ
jgi:para-aminobenzoate synthetase